MTECIYCHAAIDDNDVVPALDDAEAWSTVAQAHAEACAWVHAWGPRQDVA
jgi:hypothetical protein